MGGADVIQRCDGRVTDVVGIGHAPGFDVPVGNDIEPPTATRDPGMGDQVLAGVGIDQPFGELIDGWVFEAHEVATARFFGAFRGPVLALRPRSS